LTLMRRQSSFIEDGTPDSTVKSTKSCWANFLH
jgi:hypothetical protein